MPEATPPFRSSRDSKGQEATSSDRGGTSVPLHVHECSFVKPHVAGFSAISASRCGTRLAVSTTDGLVQLYQKFEHWKPVSVIFPESGSPEFAVSCLKFSSCDRYLCISRLDGSLSLYSVSSEGLLPHVTLHPGGGAIWDMAFRSYSLKEQFHLAIACDDGRVRFVIPDPDYPSLDPASPLPNESSHYIIKVGEKSPDRVLCVSWGASFKNAYVVCGDSAGKIRWLDPDNGRSWGNARIPPVRRNPILIWTVLVIESGNTVICGDSRGLVTLWSSQTCTMMAKVHIEGVRGAIWCSSFFKHRSNENCVVIGCANGGVAGLSLNNDGSSWNPIRALLLHTHDVRGIASLSKGSFATASIDGQILVLSADALFDRTVKVNRLELIEGALTQSPVQFSPGAKLLVVRGKDFLEFCHIPLDPESSPSVRLRMSLKGLGPSLRSFSISEDSQCVAVSSGDSFRLYRVWDGTGGQDARSLTFGKVCALDYDEGTESALWGCVDMCFGSDILVAISRCRMQVIFYNVTLKTMRIIRISDTECAGKVFSKISYRNRRVVVSDSSGSVYASVVSDEKEFGGSFEWTKIGAGSTYGDNVTCIAISPSGQRIAFAHRSETMTLVFLDKGKVKTLSENFNMTLNALSFGRHEKGLLASGLNSAFIVSWNLVRKSKSGQDGKSSGFRSYQIQLPGQVWSCGVLDAGHVIAVRKNADLVQEYLPDAIPKKKYAA